MLVDHAKPKRRGVPGTGDRHLAALDQDVAGGRVIKPIMHLTSVDLPAPFSPSSAWNEPAGTFTETPSSAVKAPKRMVMPTVFDTDRFSVASLIAGPHDIPQGSCATSAFEFDTVPKTPPCILIS